MKLLRSLQHDPRTAPLWRAIAVPVSAYLVAEVRAVNATSRVRVEGLAVDGPALYVNWHRYLPFLAAHHGQRRRYGLISPAPYMAPIARWNEALGVRLVRGASGARGHEARDELIALLRAGESAFVAVDGPAGPPLRVKRGCVDIARAAGVPIVPVGYRSVRGRYSESRWDHWLRVVPFDDVTVVYGAPITIGEDESVDDALERVRVGLGEVCDSSENPRASAVDTPTRAR
jgi:lysophospholipid acyltransferase (LPLAT)-like uncharacterized protein